MALRTLTFAIAVALPCVLLAQRAALVETGYVTGRVTCADTGGPARIAAVVLLPVVDASFIKPAGAAEAPREPMTNLVETGLDGRFVIPKVRPGSYYLLVEKRGYLQPLASITREAMNKPDAATADLIGRLLTPVTVTANHGSDVEARIYRGAVISGEVRFDDGSPMIGAAVTLLKKDKKDKWVSFRSHLASDYRQSATDDQGRYRVSGLPAGEYQVATEVETSDIVVDHVFADGGGSSSNTRYQLKVFYGDAYRSKDAKTVKVGDGQEAGGTDMTVRVSQMHPVSGAVIEANGQTVNAAKVSLHYLDDDSQLASTEVRKEDNSFHFEYVPEGEYTLHVAEARDVSREEVSNGEHVVPPTHTVEKVVRTFGPSQQPIIVHTDMQGLTVTVPPVSAATPAK